MADMQGGTFTITNGGAHDVDVVADPHVPQSGILGM